MRYTAGMNISATAMLESPTGQWRIEIALRHAHAGAHAILAERPFALTNLKAGRGPDTIVWVVEERGSVRAAAASEASP
jgi:hypothetical protein